MFSESLRIKKFIDKKFQLTVMLSFGGLLAILSLMAILILFVVKVYAYQFLPGDARVLVHLDFEKVVLAQKKADGSFVRDSSGNYFLIDTNQKVDAYNAFELYLFPILLISILNILSVLVFSFYYSHRIAGPMYRIKKVLSEYLELDVYKPIFLRRKDFLKDIGILLNRVVLTKLEATTIIQTQDSQKKDFLGKPTKKQV